MPKTDSQCTKCGKPCLGEFCYRHKPAKVEYHKNYNREWERRPEVKAMRKVKRDQLRNEIQALRAAAVN